ncbi:putative ATP-dependent RNA helicase DHX57 [Ischnura elegans]|uniref:putative ATP-dependent RNA helicase DHX57 n=1 Tax=Ischnura elegans TaxID=197161 RepID=UPI001ED89EB1|nr:putative ATP-dependent RNA helicase DHX57 [Ischnura elegans]XP_046383494.1 putative ATP-dependent RNA helicase DHX57 [Ischnura elegans]
MSGRNGGSKKSADKSRSSSSRNGPKSSSKGLGVMVQSGWSKKAESRAMSNGALEDSVVSAKPKNDFVSEPKNASSHFKVELQKLYLSKEKELAILDTLKEIHGEDFKLNEISSYKDKRENLSHQYWVTNGNLIVQGVIDYSQKRRVVDLEEKVNAFALKKLLSYGFHKSHCLESLDLMNGDVGKSLELLLSQYFQLGLKFDNIQTEEESQNWNKCEVSESDELTVSCLRDEEKDVLSSIYESAFVERIPNQVWVIKLNLDYLLKTNSAVIEPVDNKKTAKKKKETCRYFLKGQCKYTYDCKYSHENPNSVAKVPDDRHLRPDEEEMRTFELEIRFPTGCMYPLEPAVVCISTKNPVFPKESCLRITKRLLNEARMIAQDHGTAAIYTLTELLVSSEHTVRDAMENERVDFDEGRPLIWVPSEVGEESEVIVDAPEVKEKTGQGGKREQRPELTDREISREDDKIRQKFMDKQDSAEYQRMIRARKSLPAWQMKKDILKTISDNQVVVISGMTGCGKSTQVPQFLLDEWLGSKGWNRCEHREIVCTQPRRISAIGVAERVAEERVERIGNTIGYQIRLESKMSSATRLLFCTTGILLRRLESDPLLKGVSHVLVDEVHERSEESDFLLMILRDLLPQRPELKVILMSATMNADLFSSYFNGIPIVEIPGRTFPVEQFFLEDVIEMTRYAMEENSPYARPLKFKSNLSKDCAKGGAAMESLKDALESIDLEREMIAEDGFKVPKETVRDECLTVPQFFYRYQDYSKQTCKTMVMMDPEKINYDLIETLLVWIATGKHEFPRDGSILVFLPGMAEITTLHELLSDNPVLSPRKGNFTLLPLHSALSNEEQALVFQKSKPGVRKIVISTNIAETSVTIDDCVFVIDCGKMKEKRYDSNKNMESLELVWVSRANAQQRRGRAGRVMPGVCIHLYTRHRYEYNLLAQPIPALQRVPLEQLVLRIKILRLFEGKDPHYVLGQTLEPPLEESINNAMMRLQDIGALDEVNELTPLGQHLAALPVDVRIGKLMLFGAMFFCLDSALTIAACLSYKSPFVAPFAKKEEADAKKLEFSTGNSDQLTVLKAYKAWTKACENGKYAGIVFAKENYLSTRTLQTLVEMKLQLLELLVSIGFVPEGDVGFRQLKRGARSGIDKIHSFTGQELNANGDNSKLLAAILCAALYPNVVKILTPEKLYARSTGGAIPRAPKPDELKFKTKEDGYVFIHPSSVNYSANDYPSPYLVYHEKIKTSRVFIRDCSMVPVLPLVLFTGSKLNVELNQGVFIISLEDGWIKLSVERQIVAELLKTIRIELLKLLDEKIEDPTLNLVTHKNGRKIIATIVSLMTND